MLRAAFYPVDAEQPYSGPLKGLQLYIIIIQHVVCFRCARRTAVSYTLLVFRSALHRLYIYSRTVPGARPVSSCTVAAAAAARYTDAYIDDNIYIYLYIRSREPVGVLWLPLALARWNIVSYTRSNGCKWNINSPQLTAAVAQSRTPVLQYYYRHHRFC